MGLQVYYPEDIRNALLAAEQSANAAIQVVGPDNAFGAGYLAGYRAALTTIALAFGLVDVKEPRPPRRLSWEETEPTPKTPGLT